MMKLVDLIRNVLVVMLALLTSFGLGMLFSNKILEKAAESLFEEPIRRTESKVSYKDYARKRYGDQ